MSGLLALIALRVAAQTNLVLVTTVTPPVFNNLSGVALDGAGNLYVADTSNNCIREITPSGTIIILAGSANGSSGTNDGTNNAALFNHPTGLCLDPATNIYVADYSNSTVRMISPVMAGPVTNWVTITMAGQAANFSLTNGLGTNATFNHPFMLAVDLATNLYVTDGGNAVIRKITPGSNVTTYANTNDGFASPAGIAVDGSSNVYVSDSSNNVVYTIATNGTVATNASALFDSPEGIALDASTNIYVANLGDSTILEIDTASNVTIIAGTSNVLGNTNGLGGAAQFDAPAGLAVKVGLAGTNIYVADSLNNTIRKATPFNTNLMTALTLGAAPSGLPLGAAGTNYSFTPQLLGFLSNSVVVNTAALTNRGYVYGNNGLAIVSTNYYAFTNWTSNGTAVSVLTNYGVLLNSNITVVANYNPLYTLIVDISPTNSGSVSPGGGLFVAGVTNVFTATPSNGFAFTNWTATNGAVLSVFSNYSLALTNNETIIANFMPLYTLTVTNSPTNGGTVSGGQTVLSNTTVSATTTINPGYAFADWTYGTSNGAVASPANPYVFALDSNVTLVANYVLTPPRIEVLNGASLITNNQTVNFGSDQQNSNGPSVVFTVTNAGGQTLDVTDVNLPAGYTLVSSPASTIAFSASTTFTVQLTATNVGVYDGSITITNNDPTNNPFTIQITGSVTPVLRINPLIVTTVAGLGNFGAADGIGRVAKFFYPAGVATDGAGNVYVADPYNEMVRKVTPTGVVTTLAGSAQTFGTNDGTGTNALVTEPFGVAVDPSGNVFVADTFNSTIREITTNGALTTFAGVAGTVQYRDGYVTNLGVRYATFSYPYGIAIDSSTNIYVADTYANLIRKIVFDPAITNWIVSTLAGDNSTTDLANTNSMGLPQNFGTNDGLGTNAKFNHPYALAADSSGNVYVADTGNSLIRQITPEGAVTTIAGSNGNGKFSSPSGIAVDGDTNIYVADSDDQIVQVLVTTNGSNWIVAPFSPLAGQTNSLGQGLHGDSDGVFGSSVASFYNPWGLAVDSNTNLYVGDSFNGNIREITFSGTLSTLAGPDGSYGLVDGATAHARFNQPNAVAVDTNGNLYVADTLNNCIRQVKSNGTTSILAGSILGVPGANNGTNTDALFNYPTGLCLDAATNIYVADYSNSTVRMILPDATRSNWVTITLAGQVTNFGVANGLGTNATFDHPFAVAADSLTNLYVTDNGNAVVRKITPGSNVTTYASANDGFVSPVGIAVDGSGIVYVSDNENNAIYTIATNDAVTTNVSVLLNSPAGVAVDNSSNVYVANMGDNTILGISAQNSNTTIIAGTVGFVGSADGLDSASQFDNPIGVAVDALGNVYVADAENNTIRVGAPFNAGQSSVLALTTSPSGLPLTVNGVTYPVTPEILVFATGSKITNSAAATNSAPFTNANLTTITTNYYAFINWATNGGGTTSLSSNVFTLSTNVALVANYNALFNFSVSYTPANGGTASVGGTNIQAGSTVSVLAMVTNDYRFGYWSFNNLPVSTSSNYSFQLNGNETLVANLLNPLYTVAVNASPVSGGTVSGGGPFESNSIVTVTAVPTNGYVFTNWTTTNGVQESTNEAFTFTLITNETYVANFLPLYTVTVSPLPVIGGTVGGGQTVQSNTPVTVTATTNFNFAFVDWVTNGGGTNFSNPYTFLLDSNETLVAHFAPYYTLTVTNLPTNEGTVLASSGGTNGLNLTVLSNTTVTAAATTNAGYGFINWATTNGVVQNSNANYSFPLNNNETLVGNFAPYYTNMLIFSNGGTAFLSNAGISGTTLVVLSNGLITASATASNNFAFINWATNGGGTSTANPYIYPLDSNETIVANFLPTYSLSLPISPLGSGTVTGSGSAYVSNVIVNVIATPKNGYAFSDWTLNNPTGPVESVSNNYRFHIMGNTVLVANFVTTPAQIGVLNGTNPIANGQTTPVNFGSVQSNRPLPAITFTVTNLGGQPLVVTNILVPSNGYTLVTNAQATLTNFPASIVGVTNATPTNGTFVVQLITTNLGTHSGNVTIHNNGTNSTNGVFTFAVTGTVLPPAPQIEVLNQTTIVSNGQATPVNFGTNTQNQPTPITLTFTVTNSGELALNLTNITVPPGYTLVTNPPPATNIPSDGSGAFSVQLDTDTAVGESGDIVIINNDPTNNPFIFPIISEEITKILSLSGGLTFGVLPTNSSANLAFTISNTGNTLMNISSIVYSLPEFGSSTWTGGQIAASNSQPVTVTFTPVAPTNYNGLATISSDATSFITTNTVTLTGFGANESLLLTIVTNGTGSVTPNQAKIQKQGAKLSLTAVPGKTDVFAGWAGSTNSTANPLKFTMEQSSILEAIFVPNPYLPFAGTYNGLFWATNGDVTETTAGMLKGLALTSKGTFSATLLIDGASKAFSGSFDTALNASNSVKINGGTLGVGMTLVSNGPAPQVTGTVSGSNWVSTNLVADRATNNSQISTAYTMLIPADTNDASLPGGSGYATISATVGTTKTAASAKITGSLADGTAFTQTVPVSLDSYIPIYASLYSSKGLLLGWVNLTNASGDALAWFHPVVKTGLFTTEFTSTNQILLSPWTNPPAAGSLPTNLVVVETTENTPVATNGFPLVFNSDTLAPVISNSVKLLTGSLAAKTGLMKLTFGKTTGNAVILLNATNGTNGGGYFLTKTNTGPMILQGP